jgi:hypothetical protein
MARCGKIKAFNPSKNIGHEIAAFETFRVLMQSDLVIRPAVDVIKDRAWQPSSREFSKVMEIVAVAQPHGALPFESAGDQRARTQSISPAPSSGEIARQTLAEMRSTDHAGMPRGLDFSQQAKLAAALCSLHC